MSDLVACPYCCELIQPRATKCKHCQSFLIGPSGTATTVEGYGTVGAAYGVTIGGQGNQIGAVNLTLAALDEVDPATKREITKRYEEAVRSHPEQAQYHFALGLSYLDQKLYQLAASSFQRALGKTADESDLLYYLSLALIGGQRPRVLRLTTVRQIESYLSAAIQLNNDKPHYKLLLAAIKHDYYLCNGLRVPPPTIDELIEDARLCPSHNEVRVMHKHLPLPDDLRFLMSMN